MTDRPPPQSTVQAAGRVAEDVVSGLRQAPIMLGMIVLNVIAIGAAIWFLYSVGEHQSARLNAILAACLPGFEAPKP